MPILHFPGEMIPGQFGPISRVFEILQRCRHADHVERRNAFRDADDERQLGVDRFENRVRRKRRRHENHRRIRARFAHRVRDRIEYRHAEMLRAALARRHAADHFGAVLDHLLRVKAAFAPGKALHERRVFLSIKMLMGVRHRKQRRERM